MRSVLRGQKSSWNWSDRWLWAIICVWGAKPRCSQSNNHWPVPVWHLLKAITAAVHGGRPRTPTLRRLESKDTLSKLEDTVSKIDGLWPGVLVCAVIPALWSQKQADRRVQGQPGKHSEFQTRLCYVLRPCLKKRRDGWRGAGKGRKKKIIPCFKVLF